MGPPAAVRWTAFASSRSPPRSPAGTAASCSPTSQPLAGLKVFDLSTFWAGGYLTCYLGAFGADIVKLESIQRP